MQKFLELIDGTPKGVLYHYTTAGGFLGIFDSGNIWASSAYHLNDSDEFRYAAGLLAERIAWRIKAETSEQNKQHYHRILSDLPNLTTDTQVYVASFSEQADLLSQWLAYAGQGNGYAIGLSAQHFLHAKQNGFSLLKCIYKQEEQFELLDSIIDLICQFLQSDNAHTLASAKKALAALVAMKHPGFNSEAEWRLIRPITVHFGQSKDVLFRPGRNGLVPYLPAPLTSSSDKFMPTEICIGPNDDMTAANIAMKTFLSKHELRSVTVSLSNTPYRP